MKKDGTVQVKKDGTVQVVEENGLRIKIYYTKIEFDIHPAIMDAGLRNYGNVILALLDEAYGFKSKSDNDKYRVMKERTTLKHDELTNEIMTALTIIFKLLKEFVKRVQSC